MKQLLKMAMVIGVWEAAHSQWMLDRISCVWRPSIDYTRWWLAVLVGNEPGRSAIEFGIPIIVVGVWLFVLFVRWVSCEGPMSVFKSTRAWVVEREANGVLVKDLLFAIFMAPGWVVAMNIETIIRVVYWACVSVGRIRLWP